ncbi:MAG: ABC transporter permease, partial [Candidatus Omnitrophica bacterium]|nr:ABC transporter permease [Candidatus Omnitrophota bacterium]
MLNYIIRRIATIIPMLIGIVTISFFIVHLAPGKPVEMQQSLNPKVSLEVRERLSKLYGLDKPLHVQYLDWVSRVARCDFGRSFSDDRLVIEKIFERIPLTLGINIVSLFFVFLIAVPLGVKSALKPGSAFDSVTTVVIFLLFAAPTFWLALLCMQLFCIRLEWFPVSGVKSLDFEYFTFWQKIWDIGRHLFLPVMVSVLGSLAGNSRYMRSSMIEVLQQPYIFAARAKGLSRRMVIYK